MGKEIKTLVQCDFDGTVTESDISFLILDAFGRSDWEKLFKDYQQAKLSLGRFNTDAFSSVKADRDKLLELVRKGAKVRPGLLELVDCCRSRGFRFVIVSNGLRFYIDDIFRNLGLTDIETFAAETRFHPDGLKVQYVGPDGKVLDNDFKLAYTNSFLEQGYRIIYLGDGSSDLAPARKSERIFATGSLLKQCRTAKVSCTPFTDLLQVTEVIESLE